MKNWLSRSWWSFTLSILEKHFGGKWITEEHLVTACGKLFWLIPVSLRRMLLGTHNQAGLCVLCLLLGSWERLECRASAQWRWACGGRRGCGCSREGQDASPGPSRSFLAVSPLWGQHGKLCTSAVAEWTSGNPAPSGSTKHRETK